ncbi:MAG TPA: selenoneine synthase SenA [Methylibium sp.]|nr:selenoneine synthase SenA [Methylibium sp.]
MADARSLAGGALADALRDARARTLAWTFDLESWDLPCRPGVNPTAWELAHVAWFAEFWTLRGPHWLGGDGYLHAARAARLAAPDVELDSARLPHDARWLLAPRERGALAALLAAQLDAVLAALQGLGDDDAALYFHRLALFHEDMHAEAFAWTRAALGWPAPAGVALPRCVPRAPLSCAGGEVTIGRPAPRPGFAFDNEGDAQAVRLATYEIDATPVSAGRYAEFVDAGGYDEPAYWPGAAGAWRATAGRSQPERWRRAAAGGWEVRWFDRWQPLDPDQPVIHVNAWEAEAWCRWAGRRLPSAAEWEAAAPTLDWGRGVWEWTADDFQPYPGFAPGPYRDYSQPWFGSHRELRGGAFATADRLLDPCYRNFFTPERGDVFAGFRSVAY